MDNVYVYPIDGTKKRNNQELFALELRAVLADGSPFSATSPFFRLVDRPTWSRSANRAVLQDIKDNTCELAGSTKSAVQMSGRAAPEMFAAPTESQQFLEGTPPWMSVFGWRTSERRAGSGRLDYFYHFALRKRGGL